MCSILAVGEQLSGCTQAWVRVYDDGTFLFLCEQPARSGFPDPEVSSSGKALLLTPEDHLSELLSETLTECLSILYHWYSYHYHW